MTTFFVASASTAVLRCPVQPGNLSSFYYGRWTRDGATIIEVPRPNNDGSPQGDMIRASDADLDRELFTLIINFAERSRDASSNYRCVLHNLNPATGFVQEFTQASFISISLMVNGRYQET